MSHDPDDCRMCDRVRAAATTTRAAALEEAAAELEACATTFSPGYRDAARIVRNLTKKSTP